VVDNQNKQISGYRDLSQSEVDAINSVKLAETDIGLLYKQLVEDIPGIDRRWASVARTHFEEGFSALVRSIAQPEPKF
jgi:hypothetical protein